MSSAPIGQAQSRVHGAAPRPHGSSGMTGCQQPRAASPLTLVKYTQIFKASQKELLYVYVLHISMLLAPVSGHAFSSHMVNTTFFLYKIMALVELTTLQVLMAAPYR